MNLALIKQGVTSAILPAINIVKAKSPQIFVAIGIGTGIGCIVMACKATLEVDEIFEYVEEKKEKMETRLSDENDEYSEEMASSDRVKLYVQSGIKLVKLYGPAAALGVTSIVCFLGSNHILTKRNTVLVGLVSSLEQSFAIYRKRVVDEHGETTDFMYANGIYADTEEVTYIDENGKKKKKKETTIRVEPDEFGMYTRIYDDGNKNWSKSPERNMMFLRSIEKFANDRLNAYGYLFLSDVLDDLGMPETESSRVCGWTKDGGGDGYVDFGIFENLQTSQAARDFINGYEPTILLNFNCDGYIANKLPEKKVHIWKTDII
jgi:hypothetical protein